MKRILVLAALLAAQATTAAALAAGRVSDATTASLGNQHQHSEEHQ